MLEIITGGSIDVLQLYCKGMKTSACQMLPFYTLAEGILIFATLTGTRSSHVWLPESLAMRISLLANELT